MYYFTKKVELNYMTVGLENDYINILRVKLDKDWHSIKD